MKKSKVTKMMLGVVKKVAEKEVDKTVYGWPPACAGLFHQPVRPKKKK